MHNNNIRYTPEGPQENEFRLSVRNALNLDVFARNDQIIDEIRRLKQLESASDKWYKAFVQQQTGVRGNY
jgi:hypothetical protein